MSGEYDKSMRQAGLCPKCGHHGFDCTCDTISSSPTAAQTIATLRAEADKLRAERDEAKAESAKLRNGWGRLKDLAIGELPEEMFRFNESAQKAKGACVETWIYYLASLWNERDTLRQQLTNAIDERNIARKESAELAQRLAASEAREAAIYFAAKAFAEYCYTQTPFSSRHENEEERQKLLRALSGSALAQPSADPSVPREQESDAQRDCRLMDNIMKACPDALIASTLPSAIKVICSERERVQAELVELIELTGADLVRPEIVRLLADLEQRIKELAAQRSNFEIASNALERRTKERDEARAQHERLRERAGELVGYNARDAQELERLRQRVAELEAALTHIASGEIEPANVPRVAAEALAATAPDAQPLIATHLHQGLKP